jgi:hypothetical protein
MSTEQQIKAQEERYQQRIKAHEEWCQLRIQSAERERDEALGLVSAAHLELIHSIKYGFNPGTAHSTLISVGRLSPMLQARMKRMLEEKE